MDITITVNGANDGPTAVDDAVATDSDLAFGEAEAALEGLAVTKSSRR